jgi:hypothetical protein
MTLASYNSHLRRFLLKTHLIAILSFSINNCASIPGDTQAEKQQQVFIESISGDRMYMLRYEPLGPINEAKQGATVEQGAPSS